MKTALFIVLVMLAMRSVRLAEALLQHRDCIRYEWTMPMNLTQMNDLRKIDALDVWSTRELLACGSTALTEIDQFIHRNGLADGHKFSTNFATRQQVQQRQRRQATLNLSRPRANKYNRKRDLHEYYMEYEEMKARVKEIASNHSSWAKYVEYGKTAENREMFYLRLEMNAQKPLIWFDGGIHAREWLSPATAFYLIDQLVKPENRWLVESYTFVIAPILNPDGYVYSHRRNRMWRKSRSKLPNSKCYGVDLNRNFPFKWQDKASLTDSECPEIDPGPEPASEPETKNIIRLTEQLKQEKLKVKLWVSLHACGQVLMMPYSYSVSAYPPNFRQMLTVARMLSRTLFEQYEVYYKVGQTANIIYYASGTSGDYAMNELNPEYCYFIELPQLNCFDDFKAPASVIKSSGQQIFLMLTTFAKMNITTEQAE